MKEYYYKNICKTIALFFLPVVAVGWLGGSMSIALDLAWINYLGGPFGFIWGWNFRQHIKPKSWICSRVIT